MFEVVTQAEAARLIGTTSAVIQNLIAKGVVQANRQGKTVLIHISELKKLLTTTHLTFEQRQNLERALTENDKETEIRDDDQDEYIESAKSIYEQRAVTEPLDPNVGSLYQKWMSGDLILDPDFQREFVWERPKASLFIDSLAIGIPTPTVYISEEADGKWIVVDGKQRLKSTFDYISKRWGYDGTIFRLSKDLENLKLAGRSFDQLDGVTQRGIMNASIPVTIIREPFRPKIKWEIFIRINGKPTSLNHQQLRNAIYYGPFLSFTRELAQNTTLRRLVHPSRKTKEAEYQEHVLRFFAFDNTDIPNFRGSLNTLLDATADRFQHRSEKTFLPMKARFLLALERSEVLFGDKSFVRLNPGKRLVDPNGYWSKNSTNKYLYDLLTWGLIRIDAQDFELHQDSLREGFLHFFATNQRMQVHINSGLSSGQNKAVKERFELFDTFLQKLLAELHEVEEPFTYDWKWQHFHITDLCTVCKKPIQERDDAAVYGIKNYWTEQPVGEVSFAHRCCVDY